LYKRRYHVIRVPYYKFSETRKFKVIEDSDIKERIKEYGPELIK